jgi:predicted Zn-dependent protease
MKKILFVFVSICFLFSCNSQDQKKERDIFLSDYSARYSRAITSDDQQYIQDTIKYMDEIIKNGNEYKVLTVYFNQAQLYIKLGKSEEALSKIELTEYPMKDIYKLTLFARLNNYKEIQKYCHENFDSIEEIKHDFNRIFVRLLVLRLLKKDYQSFYDDISAVAQYDESNIATLKMLLDNPIEDFVTSMWPEY